MSILDELMARYYQNPQDFDTLREIGLHHKDQGNVEQAIEYFQKAEQVNNQHQDLMEQLAFW